MRSDAARLKARRPTASRRVLPSFLIIGAQKCGTGFLQFALAQHPAIITAVTWEVHYFDWNFDRGIDWYRAHFPTVRAREQSLRRHGEFASGEKSPCYLLDPSVPERVLAVTPDIKLIVLLRNPVSRAFSHYQHVVGRGYEPLSFADALASEERQGEPADQRRFTCDSYRRSYLARGRYAEQLERWLSYFDREQVHVTCSERLFAQPTETVAELQRFIGVSSIAPHNLRPWGQNRYEPMPASLRIDLQERFDPDVKRLAQILGEDPGWW